MASGKVSKNSKKTSKPTQTMMPKKEKLKKEFILIEVTESIKDKIYEDLSVYEGKEVTEILRRFGKQYLKIRNN